MLNVINNMNISQREKDQLTEAGKLFLRYMPDALFMSPYELAKTTKLPHPYWEKLLDTPEIARWIDAKLGKFTEYAARKAIYTLNDQNAAPGYIQAALRLIESSTLAQRRERPNVIMHYIPPFDEGDVSENLNTNEHN